jgi:uncharacterized coiled-coil DUF342 family protein
MAHDPTDGRSTGLQDDFDAQPGATSAVPTATTTAAPDVDAVTGAGAVAPTAAAAASAEPPEIEMPPEWARSGPPPRPQQVRDEIADKTQQAEAARQRSAKLTEQERRLDADVDVATRLLASHRQDHQELSDRMQALEARRAELVEDAARNQPDITRAAEAVNDLKRQLGVAVASDTDLMPPDGTAAPPSVTPETDPAQIAVLREQLAQAEAKLQQEIAARDTSADAELTRIKAEHDALAPQLARAEHTMNEQQSNLDALKQRADALERDANQSLEQARGLETEVKNLSDALPDYEQIWTTWAAEHPDQAKVTDLGTIEVKVPPRETAALYAQGRREEAGRLEQQAADADKAAIDAASGAQSRLDLAQRHDEEVADINQRLASSDARVATLRSQVDDANQRAEQLAADADRMAAEAKQLRAQGRTDAADTMDARSRSMSEESIKAKFRADDLQRQATTITDSTAAERARADTLSQEATKLRDDAAALSAQGTELQQQATKLREDATTRDHIAAEVEDRLQSGQAFKFQLVDDRMGESITLDVPAGPPPYAAPPADTDAGAPSADATDAGAASTATTADTGAATDDLLGDDVTGADDLAAGATAADSPDAAVAPLTDGANDAVAPVAPADDTPADDAPADDALVEDTAAVLADPAPAEAFASDDLGDDLAAPDPSAGVGAVDSVDDDGIGA